MRKYIEQTATVVALATLLLLPMATYADDADRLASIEARMMALEDQLAASEATIEAQRDLLEKHAVTPDVAEGSGLDGFLSGLQVGGHVTTSYTYNFNNPDVNANSQVLCQFNCDHNQFTLDAVKFDIGKEADSPGSAGFEFDLLFGENARIFNSLSPDAASFLVGNDPADTTVTGGSDTNIFVQQAYVAYNYNDIVLKMGKFETLLGWELIDSDLNYNVTHGILFTWAIPLFHTGLLASGNFTEEIGWAAGVVNGFNNTLDTGDTKGALGQLSYSSGPIFTSFQTYIGTVPVSTNHTSRGSVYIGDVDDSTSAQIYDWVLQYTPSEELDTWLNVDYGLQNNSSLYQTSNANGGRGTSKWYGLATGFNWQFTEKMNFAVRGEYFVDDNNVRGVPTDLSNGPDKLRLYSLTGTLGYNLTENLMARLEVRRDESDGSPDTSLFPSDHRCGSGSGASATAPRCAAGFYGHQDATYGVVEVTYVFD